MPGATRGFRFAGKDRILIAVEAQVASLEEIFHNGTVEGGGKANRRRLVGARWSEGMRQLGATAWSRVERQDNSGQEMIGVKGDELSNLSPCGVIA